uniref:Uncharacterized protein n=1 Tax=Mesocestoides corti TaxID=53468 RepID=A0A5K3ERL1_MESCO
MKVSEPAKGQFTHRLATNTWSSTKTSRRDEPTPTPLKPKLHLNVKKTEVHCRKLINSNWLAKKSGQEWLISRTGVPPRQRRASRTLARQLVTKCYKLVSKALLNPSLLGLASSD